MPLTYSRTFRVRHYECDAFGRAFQTTYLRYMQEAAFDASAAAGYTPARYEAMGVIWLVRETEITFHHPLRYEDCVQVQTWVADFRRVRSRRAYEFRLLPSRQLVAVAQTDWAFLDRRSGQPVQIPAQMMAAFYPEGAPAPAGPRPRFPAPPSEVPHTIRQQRLVQWLDLDPAGHVNNATYLAYLEDGEVQMAASLGFTIERLNTEKCTLAASRRQIEYREPAFFGDRLELMSRVTRQPNGQVQAYHTLSRLHDGALLLRAVADLGLVHLVSGQSVPESLDTSPVTSEAAPPPTLTETSVAPGSMD